MAERHIEVALECFVKKDGKYLMLHRAKHKRIMPDIWMAPGGHIEFNEGLYEAARREIMEETGLKIKNLQVKVIGNAYLKDLDQELFFYWIMADYAGGKLQFTDHDGEMVWLTPKEIAELPTLLPEMKKVVKQLFDGTHNIISYKVIYEKGAKMTSFVLEKA